MTQLSRCRNSVDAKCLIKKFEVSDFPDVHSKSGMGMLGDVFEGRRAAISLRVVGERLAWPLVFVAVVRALVQNPDFGADVAKINNRLKILQNPRPWTVATLAF